MDQLESMTLEARIETVVDWPYYYLRLNQWRWFNNSYPCCGVMRVVSNNQLSSLQTERRFCWSKKGCGIAQHTSQRMVGAREPDFQLGLAAYPADVSSLCRVNAQPIGVGKCTRRGRSEIGGTGGVRKPFATQLVGTMLHTYITKAMHL